MKRLLCVLLTVALAASMLTAFSLSASAAGGTLTVTSQGEVLGEVEVGNEFIYNVAFSSAGYTVASGQGVVNYDSRYAQFVEYGPLKSDGSINMSAYSFPLRIYNSSLASNFTDQNNEILFNFSKISGVGTFTEDDHFFKVRFKAVAPGTVDISFNAQALATPSMLPLIRRNKPNQQLDPIPYILTTVEPSVGYVGDADGDYNVTVMDATFVQLLTAGVDSAYNPINTDVNNDGAVDLRDALAILRYKSGVSTDTQIGEWIFTSESESDPT